MGSSAKKKREKQKDFQKPKLKVGKAKPKAANSTDTSFRSKAIILNQQSLKVTAPSSDSQFLHHVSLLTSKSESQRRDSLSYLTSSISSRAVDAPLPLSSITLLSKLFPLVLDGSSNVRSQLLKLLRVLPIADVQDHVSEFLPYTRAAMTHLAADIRLFAIDLLGWLLEKAGNEVVSCPGGWSKTMNCFLTVLGWHSQDSGKWSGNRINFGKPGSEGRPTARALQVMATFSKAGLAKEAAGTGNNSSAATFPIWHVEQHLLPQKSNAFGYLDLFAMSKDGENESMEDRDARLWLFDSMFRSTVERGIESARTEGGEVGRAAAALAKVIKENVKGEG